MIVGISMAIRRAKVLAERFATTRLPVLLVGARGTGKELFAQYLHTLSGRTGELVDINCAALPRDMIDGLLFGFRKGAFTGADETHIGFIEQAHQGTLFLDELLSLPDDGQRKLLRVVETGEVRRLREQVKRPVDVRVIAAVQEDLRALRADLYDRLRGAVIELPPLSARREDIVPLATYFASRRGQKLEHGAETVLRNYSWPGNVRELFLVIERAGNMVEDGVLPGAVLAESIAIGAPSARCAPAGDVAAEQAVLVQTCRDSAWNLSAAARTLRVSRSTLYRKLRKAGLSDVRARG